MPSGARKYDTLGDVHHAIAATGPRTPVDEPRLLLDRTLRAQDLASPSTMVGT